MNSSLKQELDNLKSRFGNLQDEIEDKSKHQVDREEKFKRLDQQLDDFLNTKDDIIKLNIGGKIFITKISTLMTIKNTLFHTLLAEFITNNTSAPKEMFIDRSYKHFSHIIEYFRTGKLCLKKFKRY